MKIAILGASGIGKNHARWFQRQGAEFVAFLGSSAASVQKTQSMLQETLGFTGQGYCDLNELLQQARPQAVCIASSNAAHLPQALTCIQNGVPVLCEKPLVHNPELSDAENLHNAVQLVAMAEASKVLLGTQMQYCMAAKPLLELTGLRATELTDFSMEMETKNLIPGREGRDLWIDLAPHPLSLLQSLVPGSRLGEIKAFQSHGLVSEAHFNVIRPGGSRVNACVKIGCVPGKEPLRRATLNGRAVDYLGFKDEDGVFRTRLTSGQGCPMVMPDFVELLIQNFLGACEGRGTLQVDGQMGATNLEWVLETSASSRHN